MNASPPSTDRRAVFFDRDGTLIEDVHYIARPEQVALRPGAARTVARFNAAGWLVIVVTNQSGIARGLLTEEAYRAVERRLDDLLAAQGAHIDASYHCPHLPEITGPCACRKPGLALYERAASEHGIDFARSAFIGDRLRDVQAARQLGGVGIVVPWRGTPLGDVQRARDDFRVNTTLDAAADRVLGT